jgi:D-sedoheptulose 7-phosphate isomerase
MTTFENIARDHQACIDRLSGLNTVIEAAARCLGDVIAAGGRIFICGNGGSAADAQHFAAELVGRFEMERRPFPAVALTTDTSILTAVTNDYAYESVFTRQLGALAAPGDALVGISTSGNSANIITALAFARQCGLKRVALCGRDGGRMKDGADHVIIVPSDNTARIQEAHILVLHYFAAVVEEMNREQVTP